MKTWKTMIALIIILLPLVAISPIGKTIQTVHASADSTPPSILWNKTYGGAGDNEAANVIQTSDGGYAIIGSENSFGAGGYDGWLVKTDSAGVMQWNQTYGGKGDDEASSVIQTSDGGYAIAGYTNSFGSGNYQGWLVKTDSAGVMQWNKTYGGAGSNLLYTIVQTSDDGYALAGTTSSFGAGEQEFWLVKTDSAGVMQWNQTYGGPHNDVALSLLKTSDGGYALAGSFGTSGGTDFWLVVVDSEGKMLWNQTYGGTGTNVALSMVKTSDDGYALAGETNSFGAGNNEGWLVKTDSAGTMLWNQTYGGEGSGNIASVVQTSDGGYVLAGGTNSGGKHVWLGKTDSAGVMQWNKTYGGTGSDAAFSVVQTSNGYVLAGTTTSFGAGNSDYYLVGLRSGESPPPSAVDTTVYIVAIVVIIVIAISAVALILKKRKQT